MSAILHCVITSIENDRLKQLIENMRFNKKHYEDFVDRMLMEKHTIWMDKDMVENFELLDDLPYKKAKVAIKEIEEDGCLVCELGGITWNEESCRRELYIKIELDGLYHKKEYSFRCNSPFDISFGTHFLEDIREDIDVFYDEEYGIETDTCEACNKVVVVDHDDDTGYTIANCDACDAMCCRECLDKHSELRPACPKCVEITG